MFSFLPQLANSTHIGMQSGGRISNTEGEVNNAFVDDTGENIDDNKYNKSKGLTEKNKGWCRTVYFPLNIVYLTIVISITFQHFAQCCT